MSDFERFSTNVTESGFVGMEIKRLGVPTDIRFGDEVRQRARSLCDLYPDIFQSEADSILWVSVENDGITLTEFIAGF